MAQSKGSRIHPRKRFEQEHVSYLATQHLPQRSAIINHITTGSFASQNVAYFYVASYAANLITNCHHVMSDNRMTTVFHELGSVIVRYSGAPPGEVLEVLKHLHPA